MTLKICDTRLRQARAGISGADRRNPDESAKQLQDNNKGEQLGDYETASPIRL
jgi:hypothetical protein